MLRNLHITDLTPASGETYVQNRQWCVDQGAQVYQSPVSLFDYRRMMCKDPDAIVPSDFDLIVCFGLCLNVFGSGNKLSRYKENSTVSWQYRFLAKSASDLPGSHQQLFMEALLAQNVNTTQILIHQQNHAIVSPAPLSFCFAKVRLYNPPGPRNLCMRMGMDLTTSSYPLVCNVSGPGTTDVLTHVRTTSLCEQQLDAHSVILATLEAGGSVLTLGSGELRFIRALEHAARFTPGQPIRQPGRVGTYGKRGMGGYFTSVCTTPTGTADHDESVVGRVNLKRVRRWCDSTTTYWH